VLRTVENLIAGTGTGAAKSEVMSVPLGMVTSNDGMISAERQMRDAVAASKATTLPEQAG